MEQIDACRGKRRQKALQFGGSLRQCGVVILQLPLRKAKAHRKIRSYPATDLPNYLYRETGAGGQIASIRIGATVSGLPEELVEKVAVRAVNLQAIETESLRRCCRFAQG